MRVGFIGLGTMARAFRHMRKAGMRWSAPTRRQRRKRSAPPAPNGLTPRRPLRRRTEVVFTSLRGRASSKPWCVATNGLLAGIQRQPLFDLPPTRRP